MVTRISTILFACALAIFMTASTAAAAGDDIRNSRHNMSINGIWNTTEDTTRICVFCHTPHGGQNAMMNATPPLWNKSMTSAGAAVTAASYGRHDMEENAAVGSISLACLQCHDGTQALDVMINAPGSGGWTGPFAMMTPMTGVTQSYTFNEFNSFGGTAEVANLGTNLMNDHPISIAFAEGECSTAEGCGSPGSTLAGDEFNAPDDFHADHGGKWVFDNGIKLIGRAAGDFDFSTTITSGRVASVECSSCHNPHIGTAESEMFLRIANNDNSAICLTCHVK